MGSLSEACQTFISQVKKMISGGGCSAQMLYETCWIEATFDGGAKHIMNFEAIKRFSLSAGILTKDGRLADKPAPCIPKDFEREIFIAASNRTAEAYYDEQLDTLTSYMESLLRGNPELESKLFTS